MIKIKWFQNLEELFKTERARTIIKIEGNILNCVWLDGKQKPIKGYRVKFKSSSKLKKFWERYVYGGVVKYYKPEKIFWSEQLLRISR